MCFDGDLNMLIDYLRYLAFRGRLRNFFETAVYEIASPQITTGHHLRYAENSEDNRFDYRFRHIEQIYWERAPIDVVFHEILNRSGIRRLGDPPIIYHLDENNVPPPTFDYKEIDPLPVEIVIDIHPDHWNERYLERRSYEDYPVIFRRAPPAIATFASGDKIVSRKKGHPGWGTLCGVLRSHEYDFALTCGHVVAETEDIVLERPQRIWKLPLWSKYTRCGEIRWLSLPHVPSGPSAVRHYIDAALIQMSSSGEGRPRATLDKLASVKPITTILQEEPVRFRGAGRAGETHARVSAVTVRKSIDLQRTGRLVDVGDVLMLGHAQKMYFAHTVSKPGDSGAAVRADFSEVGPFRARNDWHGMVLGSDDAAAYCTYAEYLWKWAVDKINDQDAEFLYET
jgi:hypothetical protein